MAESVYVPKNASRAEIYEALYPQLKALLAEEPDWVANLANLAAVLKEAFGFFWVGFYRATPTELVLGPFQGPLACTRIAFDKGVCGACYSRRESILVPDVEQFPGHIACSSASRSEIVVPVLKEGKVVLVLDVDSDQLDDFSEADREGLEALMHLLAGYLPASLS
ncbi:MAG: GAF domain-containing protein [Microscillaceae bacterium]